MPLVNLLGAFACFYLALWFLSWLFSPGVSGQPQKRKPDEVAAAIKARDVSFDPQHPPVIYQEVDYNDGPDAPWRPKNESPILAELVEEGLLPPLQERMPEEPVVLKGPDSIGNYGGTWLRVASSPNDAGIISDRMSSASFVRWSPLGYPLVPHVAKHVEVSDDKREYVITLRKGLKWSDGHPFTAADVMYSWEHEINNEEVRGSIPGFLKSAGVPATVEKIDELHVRISFAHPTPQFLENIAEYVYDLVVSPAHYLRQYHPTIGDEGLIQKTMEVFKYPSKRALYVEIKKWRNPEHPRLWPWIYRTYRSNPPHVFVRNPYYFAVDTEGNQLPYIDRVQFGVQDSKMMTLSAANGMIGMQTRHIRYDDYTELMSRLPQTGGRVLHWYPASRSVYVVNPNLNRRVEPDRPETKWKAQLLSDKRFRQALSLAINREAIIKAEYNGQCEPAQVAPSRESPFYHDELYNAFTEYDPQRANRMLDDLGLTERDYEGCRTFPDSSRMVFYLNFCSFTGFGPTQFVVDDWAAVGVRVIPRERSRPLFAAERDALIFDLAVWTGESEFLPMQSPRHFVPPSPGAMYAPGWNKWFSLGGYYGDEEAQRGDCIEPPKDHPAYHALEAYLKALTAVSKEEQREIFTEALDIATENTWTINIATPPPQLVVVQKGMRNVPENAMYGVVYKTPGNTGIETYYFEDPDDSPGTIEATKQAIANATPRAGSPSVAEETQAPSGGAMGVILKWLTIGIVALFLLLISLRHPYVGRRLLIMIPTLLIISAVVFTIIQLPPGDFLTTRIMRLEEMEGKTDMQGIAIEDLEALFHFDETPLKLYARWMGLYWFQTFEQKDKGLLQGSMGRSMETTQMVNDIVGDRILLTFLISLGTILFTWATAIPIGIYSAVRQYSIGDYALTFIGFIGMCVPSFLLALILMALTGVSGLFSAQFAAQADWTWPKVFDLLKHIWIPVIVLGVGGTAGMIRIMRGNLLDELKKPYVITARAKGVHPVKLLFKYPVRLALNPFISGIGGLFPQLVSGGAIVAMVLSLPTVGPLLLAALFSEDMYLAGSMLMVLSMLGVFGTLVSDLMLLWLDPRIRFGRGTR